MTHGWPGERRARARRTPSAAARLRIAALVLASVALGTSGCTGGNDPPEPEPTPDRGTPLAEVDTLRLTVPRSAFCDAVPPEAVTRALGAEPTKASTYEPGDRVRLTAELKDVAHEFGCRFRGPRHAEARAWVFAPPVTRGQAKALADDAAGVRGCDEVAGAAAFGRPSAATWCPSKKAGVVTFAGLFGDAWLSCSVAADSPVEREELVDRAGRWCAAVTEAASAP